MILAWVILRDHQLSWPRGEMTAVIGMIALVLVLYVGADRPAGDAVRPGLAQARLVRQPCSAARLIAAGGALRASGTERPRKPPGVL